MDQSPDSTTRHESVIARHRFVIAIVIAVSIPAFIAGLKWHQWTRTDAYQIQCIEAEAEALLPQLEGTAVSDHWLAMLALVKNRDWAAIKPSKSSNPYYEIQALRLVGATLAKAGLTSRAEEFARVLKETARPLQELASEIKDPVQQVTALQMITVALADAGSPQTAVEAAQQTLNKALSIPDASVRSLTLGTIAAEHARHGLTIEAKKAALEINDQARRLNALSDIASILSPAAPNDQTREIERLIQEAATSAWKSALQEQNPRKRGRALASVVSALAQANLVDQAWETALLIDDQSSRSEVFWYLARLFSQNDNLARGKDAAIQYKDTAIKIAQPRERWGALVSATKLLVKCGATDQAREAALLAKSTAFQVKEVPTQWVSTLGETAVALAEAGMIESARDTAILARDTAIQIQHEPDRSNAILYTIRGLARSGAIEEAQESARTLRDAAVQLQDPRHETAALMSLTTILVANGLTPIAQDTALQIKDPSRRSEALISIVEYLSRGGQSDRVREAELLARKAAYQVEHPLYQSVALSFSAKELAKLELLDDASRIAELISNPVNRSAALATIAKALARKGRFRDARVTAEACDQASDRLDTFTTILGEHAKMTKTHLARWIDDLETQPAQPSMAQSGSPNAR